MANGLAEILAYSSGKVVTAGTFESDIGVVGASYKMKLPFDRL
jgi:hypothetical protein